MSVVSNTIGKLGFNPASIKQELSVLWLLISRQRD
jgi:hypothetical protein